MSYHHHWIYFSRNGCACIIQAASEQPLPSEGIDLVLLTDSIAPALRFSMMRAALALALIVFTFSSFASDDAGQKDAILDTSSNVSGGDFALQSSQGKLSLDQFRGKVVLLYFGYTKCPDVCPTSLATLSQALNELSEDDLNFVQTLFISVDPERDSFELLDKYANYFHDNIIGVTGSVSEIDEVAKRYGAQYEKVELSDSNFGYAINHSAQTYLITPEGELAFMLPHQTPSFVVLEAIKYLLPEKH